jgi:hypothetical protein
MRIRRSGDMNKKVLRRNKYIYGLVQAARNWHEKFKEAILKEGFKGNHSCDLIYIVSTLFFKLIMNIAW